MDNPSSGGLPEKEVDMVAPRKPVRKPRKKKISREQQESEQFRQSMRELTAPADAATKADQDNCPHLQGSKALSDAPGCLSSIVWHKLDRNGLTTGICTNCLRKFVPTDSDYLQQYRRPSGNRLSCGGTPLPLMHGESDVFEEAVGHYISDDPWLDNNTHVNFTWERSEAPSLPVQEPPAVAPVPHKPWWKRLFRVA